MSNAYYEITTTDCDHCESNYVKRFGSNREAGRYQDKLCEDAEGSVHFWRISKEEYVNRKGRTRTRDRILEAHENGHAHCVRSY